MEKAVLGPARAVLTLSNNNNAVTHYLSPLPPAPSAHLANPPDALETVEVAGGARALPLQAREPLTR